MGIYLEEEYAVGCIMGNVGLHPAFLSSTHCRNSLVRLIITFKGSLILHQQSVTLQVVGKVQV